MAEMQFITIESQVSDLSVSPRRRWRCDLDSAHGGGGEGGGL